jgi:hypothetical protein
METTSTPMLGNLLTRKEFADAMHITPRSADRWAWQRMGPPRFKIGNKAFYDRTDVESYLQKKKQAVGWGNDL